MRRQLGFHHDMQRCTGCRACVVACRNHRRLEGGLKWREVYPYPQEPGRHFLSVACNHCENPECVRVCARGAFQKMADGTVVQDSSRCSGCRLCTLTCPYGAPRYSPRQRKVSKCDFCQARREAGLDLACTAACPTRALSVIDLTDASVVEGVASVPGFPGGAITTPSVRFTLPERGQRSHGQLSQAALVRLSGGKPVPGVLPTGDPQS